MTGQSASFTWNGPAIRKEMRSAVVRGLGKWNELLLQRSTAVVPLDDATLQNSATPSVDERTLTAAVSYDTPYAVRQHEDLTYRHEPGRQAKYLEQPWAESVRWAGPLIAKEIRKATGK